MASNFAIPTIDHTRHVKIGPWWDYSDNPTERWKITIWAEYGVVFGAFVAIAVTFSQAQSWRILKYILHQSRDHHKPRMVMLREQEIYLRSDETDLGAARSMLSILWNWRNFGSLIPDPALARMKDSWRSTQFVFFLASFHWLLFTCLAVLIPIFLTSSNPIVVSNSSRCNQFDMDVGSMFSVDFSNITDALNNMKINTTAINLATVGLMDLQENLRETAIAYYDACYSSLATENCGFLVTDTLPYVSRQDECPFSKDICLPGVKSVTFEMLDSSLAVLGVNTPRVQALTFKKKMTCSLLDSWQFMHIDGDAEKDPENTKIVFKLSGMSLSGDSSTKNPTFMLPDLVNQEFGIKVFQPRRTWDEHLPPMDPRLRVKKSDVTVVIVRKPRSRSLESIDDPMFASHRKEEFMRKGAEDGYTQDEPFAMIGCTKQLSLKGRHGSESVGWRRESIKLYNRTWPLLDDIQEQQALLKYLQNGLKDDVFATLDPFKSYQWLSTSLTGNTFIPSGKMPSNQWVQEVRRWFEIDLSILQVKSIISTLGPSRHINTAGLSNTLDKPYWRSVKDIYCKNTKFRSSSHASINLIGLLIYMAISSLIWFCSCGDGVIGRLMFKRSPHRVLAWKLDSLPEVLRQLREKLPSRPLEDSALPYGTLGVPTLGLVNGNQYSARFAHVSTQEAHQLKDFVRNLTVIECQDILGVGNEERLAGMCKKGWIKTCEWSTMASTFLKHQYSKTKIVLRTAQRYGSRRSSRTRLSPPQVFQSYTDGEPNDTIDLIDLDNQIS